MDQTVVHRDTARWHTVRSLVPHPIRLHTHEKWYTHTYIHLTTSTHTHAYTQVIQKKETEARMKRALLPEPATAFSRILRKKKKKKKKRKELETGKAESGNTRDLSLHACACEIVNRGHGKREKDGKKHRKLARLHTKDSLSFPIVSFLPWRKVKGRR